MASERDAQRLLNLARRRRKALQSAHRWSVSARAHAYEAELILARMVKKADKK